MRVAFEAPLEQLSQRRATYLAVHVPDEESDLLDDLGLPRGGFGSIKVAATIGSTRWPTSVFPVERQFLLLVARRVATAENLEVGEPVRVTLDVLAEGGRSRDDDG